MRSLLLSVLLLAFLPLMAQQPLFMGVSTGGGVTFNHFDAAASNRHLPKSTYLGIAQPTSLYAGLQLDTNLALKTGFKRVLQTFRYEAEYSGQSFIHTTGTYRTEIPVGLRFHSPLKNKINLLGELGMTFNFSDGQTTFRSLTTVATPNPYPSYNSDLSSTKIMDGFSVGYYGKIGLQINKISATEALNFELGYFAPLQKIYSGQALINTSERKSDFYNFYSHGDYTTLTVSYEYDLHTGLIVSKEEVFAKNGLYAEIGGGGGFYSLNYDRIFLVKRMYKLSGRVGFELVPRNFPSDFSDIAVPVSLNALLFETNDNHLEISAGQTFSTSNAISPTLPEWAYQSKPVFSLFGFIGYRYQKNEPSFIFRAGYNPLWVDYNRFTHWFGLSVGKSF